MPSPTGGGEGAIISAESLALWAGLRILDLQRGELAADREVVVVEHQCARDAVLVELERDRVDRNLLAGLFLFCLVEIAHGDGPALHAGWLFMVACRVVVVAIGT